MTPTRTERFWKKVAKGSDTECWPWLAAHNSEGYGAFWDGTRSVQAHRFAYADLTGPIPDGLTLDHLCRNRECVNPAHLEPVTNRENILRGEGPTAQHARQTHCIRGHELSGANLGRWRDTGRSCRECGNQRQRMAYLADPAKRRAQKREQKRRWRASQKLALNETP